MRSSTSRPYLDYVINTIDAISIWSGKLVAWLIFPMFLVLVYEVLARKFYQPTVWAVDVSTMAYGAHFFIAGAYTLYKQEHIRTDFVSKNWSVRTQLILDIVQYVLFFLPGIIILTWISWKFAFRSWHMQETMLTTWRPIAYPYKMIIPLSGLLLALQGMSELIKSIRALRTGIDYRPELSDRLM